MFKGKVGLKVGLKQLSMQDMLQDLAQRALWVQVQDKTSQDTSQLLKVSLSGLYCAPWCKSTHPCTCPPNRTPTPCSNNGQAHSHPTQDG